MRVVILIGLLAVMVSLSGCAGVGIVASSDPMVKLSDASHLVIHSNRPLPAERLIREAIVIYEKNKSQAGLANAYNQYGWFFMSQAVGSWEKAYKRDGFLHPTATFESRFTIALDYFKKAEAIQSVGTEFDDLSNTYLGMGILYQYHLGDSESACKAFDKSLAAYHKNIEANPEASVQLPDGYSSFSGVLRPMQKQAGCSE